MFCGRTEGLERAAEKRYRGFKKERVNEIMKTKVQLKLMALQNKVLIRFMDTTTYLLKSPNNKARLVRVWKIMNADWRRKER